MSDIIRAFAGAMQGKGAFRPRGERTYPVDMPPSPLPGQQFTQAPPMPPDPEMQIEYQDPRSRPMFSEELPPVAHLMGGQFSKGELAQQAIQQRVLAQQAARRMR